jgi:hypothetical protein
MQSYLLEWNSALATGVFDRFLSLKIVAAERDTGWVAHIIGKLQNSHPEVAKTWQSQSL